MVAESTLDERDRHELLRIARESIRSHLERRTFDTGTLRPALGRPAGAFVTLTVAGTLRGCIGTLDATTPLWRAVAESAASAATRDPRFPPLSAEELSMAHIEISVLGAFEPVRSVDQIVVGRDGLIMCVAGRSGLLLPQVPVEWGWDRDEFLEHLCRKAGVPTGSWRRPDCKLERFTAEVFGEPQAGGGTPQI